MFHLHQFSLAKTIQITVHHGPLPRLPFQTPPGQGGQQTYYAQQTFNHHPVLSSTYSFDLTCPPPIRRAVNITPILDNFTSESFFGTIPVSRKRNGGSIHSTKAKNPITQLIKAYTHPITGVEPKPNCQIFRVLKTRISSL